MDAMFDHKLKSMKTLLKQLASQHQFWLYNSGGPVKIQPFSRRRIAWLLAMRVPSQAGAGSESVNLSCIRNSNIEFDPDSANDNRTVKIDPEHPNQS